MLFTKKMTPVVAEEYSEASLEVEVGLESGEVQWMRQGVLIHPGAKYTLKRRGRKHSLAIHRLAMSDRGIYSCETLHDRTQAQLTVERECSRVLTMPCCCLFTAVAGGSASRASSTALLLLKSKLYRLSKSNSSDWGPRWLLLERDGS